MKWAICGETDDAGVVALLVLHGARRIYSVMYGEMVEHWELFIEVANVYGVYRRMEELGDLIRGICHKYVRLWAYVVHPLGRTPYDYDELYAPYTPTIVDMVMSRDGEEWKVQMEDGSFHHRLGGPACYTKWRQEKWMVEGQEVAPFGGLLSGGDVERYIADNPENAFVVDRLSSAGLISVDAMLLENLTMLMI